MIKMDIEGAEPLALDGMAKVLAQNSRIMLLTEFAPNAICRLSLDPAAFLERLLNLGFFILAVDEDACRLAPVFDAETAKAYHNSGQAANLFCFRLD